MKKTQQEAQKSLRAIQTSQDQAATMFKQATDSSIAAVMEVQQQVQARMEKLSEQIDRFVGDAPEYLEAENSDLEILDSELETLLEDLDCASDGVAVNFTNAIGEELVPQ